MAEFAINALDHLSSNVSCRTSRISKFIKPPKTAAELVNNLSKFIE